MKVKIEIRARVRYSGEIELSQADYDAWCEKIDNARGFRRDDVAQELMDEAGIRIGEPEDEDDFEIDTFESAVSETP